MQIMYRVIEEVIVAVGLGILAFWDLRTREVLQGVVIVIFLVGICLVGIRNKGWSWEWAYSLIPGLICFILARITREAIGYGDAMVISMLSVYFSLHRIITICWYALLGAAAVSVLLVVCKKRKKEDEIPFIPFLFGSDLISLLGERFLQ